MENKWIFLTIGLVIGLIIGGIFGANYEINKEPVGKLDILEIFKSKSTKCSSVPKTRCGAPHKDCCIWDGANCVKDVQASGCGAWT